MTQYPSIIILLNLLSYTDESRFDSNTTSFLAIGVTSSPSQSLAQMGLSHTDILIIAVCVSAGFLLMLLVVILVTTVLLLGRRKQKRGIITSVVHLLNIIMAHLHFQVMPQSQIIFLLMIILFTLQWRKLIWTRTVLMKWFIWELTCICIKQDMHRTHCSTSIHVYCHKKHRSDSFIAHRAH